MDRRMSGFALVYMLAAPLVACRAGGAATPPESANANANAHAAERASAPVVPVSTVKVRVDPNAELVVYLDGASFRASPFFRSIETGLAIVPGVGAARNRLEEQCGFDPIRVIEAVAFSGTLEQAGGSTKDLGMSATAQVDSTILTARVTEPTERVFECIMRLAPQASQATIEGRRALEMPDGFVVAADDDLLLLGDRQRVASALSRPPSTLPPLESGTYLHARLRSPNVLARQQVTLSVGRAPSGTRLKLLNETSSAESAASAEVRIREALQLAKQRVSRSLETEADQRHATKMLDAVVIERKGNAVNATLDLPNAETEAAFTGMLSALAAYGVRRYITQAKAAEARATVAIIAKHLAEHATNNRLEKFPKGAPRTPKDVPAGRKFAPDAKTWSHAGWKAIRFTSDAPQYYAYEYETSPNGKLATVRAHGDLDGDGATSLFELTLEITPSGEVVIAPESKEVEPLE